MARQYKHGMKHPIRSSPVGGREKPSPASPGLTLSTSTSLGSQNNTIRACPRTGGLVGAGDIAGTVFLSARQAHLYIQHLCDPSESRDLCGCTRLTAHCS